ncbi:UDP-glucosyltransferase 2-like [Palaemon carinicauda]|uniref:UDP-glucosyltransferase 2-like n=1 Tax=Palaemon carinicauda TaxID=392227 RepID=UPI0035B609F5
MKLIFVVLLVIGCVNGNPHEMRNGSMLAPPERPYKILMLLPVSTDSHRTVFLSLAKGLADRGHKVVMLTNNDGDRIITENLYEFTHGIEELHQFNSDTLVDLKGGVRGNIDKLLPVFDVAADKLYANAEINELYRKRTRFDIIIIHAGQNEVMLPFVHELPFITIAPKGLDYRHSSQMGNPLNPAYVPFVYSTMTFPMSLLQRLRNAWYHLVFSLCWDVFMILPNFQKKLWSKFPNLPPLSDIERNQSLTLTNSHFSLGSAVPLLPSQVEVACMQCRSLLEPLPNDLQEWIDGSGTEGVIYVNIGSFSSSSSKDEQFLKILLEAFNRIHQRIIWRYEEIVPNLPMNVMIMNGGPQQDILGHPKVKAFLTHGGLLSFQEAVYHGKQLFALPSTLDQTKNSKAIVDKGIGVSVPLDEVTSADQIVDGILDLIQDNKKYKKNMAKLSYSFRDQIHTPLDRAIYWTEYIIRNPGAAALKSPSAQLSWTKFLLLDILAIFLVIIFLIHFLVSCIVKRFMIFLRRKYCRRNDLFSLPLSAKQKIN